VTSDEACPGSRSNAGRPAGGGLTCGYDPNFKSGVTKCASSGPLCPSGFSCDLGRNVCVADGGQNGNDGSVDQPTSKNDAPNDQIGGGSGGGTPDAPGSGGGAGTGGSGGATGTDAPTEVGCTADIATSPTNCGACGHSCGGGACDRGVCQSFVLSGITATSIDVDATRIYFTQSTKVLACPKSGCVLQPTQLDDMGSGGYDTWSVVVTNGSLFFMSAPTQAGTEHDDLFMCALTGCPSPAPIIASALFGVQYLSNAGNDVYWSIAEQKKTFRRVCQPNAGACDAIVTIIPEAVGLRLLAARADEFYFVDAMGLQKCPYAGCPGTVATATGATLLTAMVPTAIEYQGNLVWMQFGDPNRTLSGAIRTCATADCDAQVAKNFIANREPIRGLHVDDGGVYWMEGTTLYGCPRTGCVGGAKTLATGVTRMFNNALSTRLIVSDQAFLYWINDDAGVVKGLAK
jgi:hypothetical protein